MVKFGFNGIFDIFLPEMLIDLPVDIQWILSIYNNETKAFYHETKDHLQKYTDSKFIYAKGWFKFTLANYKSRKVRNQIECEPRAKTVWGTRQTNVCHSETVCGLNKDNECCWFFFIYTNVLVRYLLSIANSLKRTNEMERTAYVLFIWLV